MKCLSPSRRVRILWTATVLIGLGFPWAACFRDPNVGKMKCTTECPAGFACVNPDPSGPNGRCHPIGDGGTDSPGLVKEDGAIPGRIDAVPPDGARLDVAGPDSPQIEAGLLDSFGTSPDTSPDTSPNDGSFDQPIDSGTVGNDAHEVGGQGGIMGSGGGSGTGGVGGATGLGGMTGNRDAASGGGSGTGGNTSTMDASISTGGSPGTGGVATGGAPGTGGSGTGGNGTGGSGTGGAATGGVPGTGGSGTGGSGTGGVVTGGAPGTGGSGTGGSGTGGGGAGGCQNGQVGASEVVFMGDSFYAMSPQYNQKRVEANAHATGALAAIDSYRNVAVSGQTLSYIASNEWNSISGAVKVVIMDGGGVEGASSPCSSCPDTFNTLLTKMASNGVQDVIYTRYPEPGNPPGSNTTAKGNYDILMPQLQTVCEGATGLRCHWVDLRSVWVNGDTTDGFHPTQSGGNHVGDAIWAEMVKDCIAQ